MPRRPSSTLWQVERYPEFLLRRRELIAAAANRLLGELHGGSAEPQEERAARPGEPVTIHAGEENEDREIEGMQRWMYEQGLARGIRDFALLALDGASEDAVLDVAWPDGLIHGDAKVALLLNEPPEILEAAGRHGHRFFTSVDELRRFVDEQLAGGAA